MIKKSGEKREELYNGFLYEVIRKVKITGKDLFFWTAVCQKRTRHPSFRFPFV